MTLVLHPMAAGANTRFRIDLSITEAQYNALDAHRTVGVVSVICVMIFCMNTQSNIRPREIANREVQLPL